MAQASGVPANLPMRNSRTHAERGERKAKTCPLYSMSVLLFTTVYLGGTKIESQTRNERVVENNVNGKTKGELVCRGN